MKNISYETQIQKDVVEYRLSQGYEFLGYSTNISGVGSYNVVINKGRHLMCVNSLGYDSVWAPSTFREDV